MATIKPALPVALLLCGLMVIGYSIQTTEAKPGMMCPMYCMNATYMTCPPKNTEKLPPACNCCIAENSGKRGCTIYLGDGGSNEMPMKSLIVKSILYG